MNDSKLEAIFARYFMNGMARKDLKSFKRTYPTLFNVIMKSLRDVAETAAKQTKPTTNIDLKDLAEIDKFCEGLKYLLAKNYLNGLPVNYQIQEAEIVNVLIEEQKTPLRQFKLGQDIVIIKL